MSTIIPKRKLLAFYGGLLKKLSGDYRFVPKGQPGEFLLRTKYGTLSLTIFPLRENERHGLASVYCRFDEPARAAALGCNPYSGKWNFHYGPSCFAANTPAQVIGLFMASVASVL